MSNTRRRSATTTKRRPAPQAAPADSKGRRATLFWIVGGVLVVAFAVVIAMSLGSTEDTPDEFGSPTYLGSPLPEMTNTGLDPAVGAPIPEVTGADFTGAPVSIENDGVPKAIVFLAHWCPHCQEEVPLVQSWLDAGGGVDGVEILSVATSINSARTNYPPSSWLEREGWTQGVVVDDTDNLVLQSYGAGAFPYWVFLNADGTVAARSEGRLDVPQLEAFLNAIAASSA